MTRRVRTTRRGFVLPLVIMLIVVVGLVTAVMLSRDRVQDLAVQRQVEAYQVHHGVMGIWVAFEAWAANKNSTSLPDLLDPDGHAFSIDAGGGSRIDIALADGQGTLRANASGLDDELATDLAAAVQALVNDVPQQELPLYLREVGPWQVSAASASPEVLRAIAMGLVQDDDAAEAFALAVAQRAAEDDDFGREDLNNAMADVGLEASDRAKINRIMTVEPTLYRVRIGVFATGPAAGRGLLKHYRALVSIRPRGSNVPTGSKPSAPFLDWQELPVESYTVWPG